MCALCFVALLVGRAHAEGWVALGPFGGPAALVLADPHRPGTVLAGANNGLLFRSRNHAEDWEPVRFPAQLRGVLHVLAVDPQEQDTYFAGLGGNETAGLWKSADAGATWQWLPGLRGIEVWSLAFWPGDSKVMAAGVRNGILLSRDGGENWARISPADHPELQPVVAVAFDPGSDKVIYAGTTHLPWKTVDGGASWHSIRSGMLDDSDVFSIQVDRKDPKQIYATACSGIYSSANSGKLWKKLTGAQGASYRTYFIIQHPAQAGTLFAGTNRGLVKSTDSGTTWRQLSAHSTRSLSFDPVNPERMFVATDEAGILRSDDGGVTLRPANRGFCNRYVASLAATGRALYANATYDSGGGVFRLDGARGWERLAVRTAAAPRPAVRTKGGAMRPVPIAPAAEVQRLLALTASSQNTRIYGAGLSSLLVSPDGSRWTSFAGPPTRDVIHVLLADPADHAALLAATDKGVYRRDVKGVWKQIPLPGSSSRVRSLVALDHRAAAVTSFSTFVSNNGGPFSPLGALPEKAEFNDLVQTGERTLYAATSHGLMRSENDGASWQIASETLRGTVSALCRHPSRPGVLYAAHYGVVYEGRAGGEAWHPVSPETSAISSIRGIVVLKEKADTLYVLTHRQGVFALPLALSKEDLR